MQKLISKYAVAAHLALLAVSPLFLFPFCGADAIANVVLWLSLLAAIWVVIGPSRMAYERMHDARRRVFSGLVRDPITWIFLILCIMAAVRWLNGGIAMAYDAENGMWYLREPQMPILPGSVDGAGRLEFAAVLATGILIIGIRHALGRLARLSWVFTTSFLAAIAAVIVICAAYFCNSGAMTAIMADYSRPSFAGMAFGINLLGGIVALFGGFRFKWNLLGPLFAFAIGGCAAGMFLFAPTAVVTLFTVAALLTLLFCLVWAGVVMRIENSMKCFCIIIVAVVIAVSILIFLAPKNIVDARLAEIMSFSFFPDGFAEMRALLSDIAAKVWRNSPWLGSGLGSFHLDIRFNAADADWEVLKISQSAALNGWWSFIAERGIVGAISFALPIGFLAFSFLRRLPGAFGRHCFLPGCWLGLVVIGAAVAETFIDVSFLRPEATMMLGSILAIIAGALPPVRRSENKNN